MAEPVFESLGSGPPRDFSKLMDHLNCVSRFGMGTGYTLIDGYSYCETCPLKKVCWDKHKESVQEADPRATEEYHKLVQNIAKLKLWNLDRAHAFAQQKLMAFGTPDPYNKRTLQNMDAGMDRRKQDDPSVINRTMRRPA